MLLMKPDIKRKAEKNRYATVLQHHLVPLLPPAKKLQNGKVRSNTPVCPWSRGCGECGVVVSGVRSEWQVSGECGVMSRGVVVSEGWAKMCGDWWGVVSGGIHPQTKGTHTHPCPQTRSTPPDQKHTRPGSEADSGGTEVGGTYPTGIHSYSSKLWETMTLLYGVWLCLLLPTNEVAGR